VPVAKNLGHRHGHRHKYRALAPALVLALMPGIANGTHILFWYSLLKKIVNLHIM